jgi:hypothetical protein
LASYAITGQKVSIEDWEKVGHVCESAIKSLLIIPTRVTENVWGYLQSYLFHRVELEESGIRGSQLVFPIYKYYWFEFIFTAGDDIACPVRTFRPPTEIDSCSEIHCKRLEEDLCGASIKALKFMKGQAQNHMHKIKEDLINRLLREAPNREDIEKQLIKQNIEMPKLNDTDIPPERRSAPLSLTRMAQYWGGDMTPKKLRSMIASESLKVIEINRQTFIFDTKYLPADVINKAKR